MKIIIVEDNKAALIALENKLSHFSDINICEKASNGKEVLDVLQRNNDVDLILMDIEMPIMNGIEATSIIKEKYPQIKVVIITIFDDDQYVFEAIKSGADSYILKETKSEKIYETIVDTMNGGAVMSPSIALKALDFLRNNSTAKKYSKEDDIVLSVRETEILEQIMKGYTNKIIAENLFISPFTVKRHIENIYKKLQAHNRIELLQKAQRRKFF